MLAVALLLAGAEAALVTAPLTVRSAPTARLVCEPRMQFDFFKKKEPAEAPPPPAKKSAPITSAPGGLFGAFANKAGRKSDGGMTTSGFRSQPASGKKGKALPEPEKWINGRSGPKINPEWSAWSKNR